MYIKTLLKSLLTLELQRKDTRYNNSIYIARYKLHNILYDAYQPSMVVFL